jgi:hypothetical protein
VNRMKSVFTIMVCGCFSGNTNAQSGGGWRREARDFLPATSNGASCFLDGHATISTGVNSGQSARTYRFLMLIAAL